MPTPNSLVAQHALHKRRVLGYSVLCTTGIVLRFAFYLWWPYGYAMTGGMLWFILYAAVQTAMALGWLRGLAAAIEYATERSNARG